MMNMIEKIIGRLDEKREWRTKETLVRKHFQVNTARLTKRCGNTFGTLAT